MGFRGVQRNHNRITQQARNLVGFWPVGRQQNVLEHDPFRIAVTNIRLYCSTARCCRVSFCPCLDSLVSVPAMLFS